MWNEQKIFHTINNDSTHHNKIVEKKRKTLIKSIRCLIPNFGVKIVFLIKYTIYYKLISNTCS
jgi:hypothetical protein